MENPIFAVVGDVHGEIWKMIALLAGWEKSRGLKLDFVLQVGDFEPHRDEADLSTMAAPAKYRKLGDFPLFARAQAHFPWPIFFVGGNHEPYGFLDQMPDGGEVAPNCHYLGRVGLRTIGESRVAFLSGIFRPELFSLARPEVAQIGTVSNKNFIAWNQTDIEQLLFVGRADLFLLHEWPPMPFDGAIRHQAESGADWIELAVESLRPRHIFCGHAHFRWRGEFAIADGAPIPVDCLAIVGAGKDAFAVFQSDENGVLRALD